ncbi:hypothetical protein [Pseudobacteriovorax antillogorgiicola]|uniref:Uncharacterized protein n=1 Tax=Pseudobacteriovorax antillogorgiicola TaxID=1513793 RepID=A0A1Y6BLB3_9BACT|nr:hypothetical protein [Pseudobacteriovorax antillogorgiicola]TCS54635.1 hypothetical protein EDD56_106148 [Pseudobacteriovorax antillogorgiicola]SMF17125.1 hypothetical protein SAMN06296036_10695 [Pseudobacteriovorax antillogorgiicola]
MTKLGRLFETIQTTGHDIIDSKQEPRLFEYNQDLHSWVRVESEVDGLGEPRDEFMVIDKDQDGYWFAW